MSDHVRHNQEFWDADADDYQAAHGTGLDAQPLAWGAWRIPESGLRVLGDVAGLDVLELGCGAAQWSIALGRLGARVVGLDQSRNQLRHAGGRVPLVCASGEATPFRAASFDVVFCDHGAMSFCDPYASVPEVARLLRPGGRLAFCLSSPLRLLCDDGQRLTRRLHHRWFGMQRFDWPEGTTDFQLPYGDWIRLFQRYGFEVRDLVHLRPPKGATTTYDEYTDYRWARRWPGEDLWVARKRL